MAVFLQTLAASSVTDMGFWILADSVGKACVILLIAALFACALRKSSAALRHLTWEVSLIAVLLVPFLSIVVPSFRVLPSFTRVQPLVTHEPGGVPDILNPLRANVPTRDARPANDPTVAAATFPLTLVSVRSSVLIVWAIGVAVMLLRILLSCWILRGITNSAEPLLDVRLSKTLSQVRDTLKVNSTVHVYLTERRSIPMVWGILKTNLLLPTEAMHWETGRTRAVLLHELGHVKRRDMATHVFTQAVCSIYWFHPLIWLAAWRVHVERERACDDLVVASGLRASEYAKHLLAVITRFRSDQLVPCAAVGMAKSSTLEGRVLAILNEEACRKPLTKGLFSCALLIGLMGATALATLRVQASSSQKPDERPAQENLTADNDGAEQSEGTSQDDSSGQISDADREAEAALRDLGAQIGRNGDKEVIVVAVPQDSQVTDADFTHLEKLHWSKTRGFTEHDGGNWLTPGLYIRTVPKTKAGVLHLKGLIHLRALYLMHNKHINDDWLPLLNDLVVNHLTELEWLALHDTPNITNKGLESLKGMTNLTHFVLNNTRITDEGLVHLKELSNLKQLWLYKNRITGDGIRYLKELANLEWLYLDDTDVSDANLPHLKELPSLRRLGLMGTDVTDDGLKVVGTLKDLVLLRIGGTDITNQGLEHLKRLVNLEELWISTSAIGNEGLTHLKDMRSVKRLFLFNETNITDDGLEYLSGLTNLDELTLRGTKVTREGIERLQDALSNCKITHIPDGWSEPWLARSDEQ